MGKKSNKKMREKNDRTKNYNMEDMDMGKYNQTKQNKAAGHNTQDSKKFDTTHREKPEAHPVAALLVDNISQQISGFLQSDPESWKDQIGNLFYIGAFPSDLTGCEGAENYSVYQLERTARLNRDDATVLARMSTSMVLINKTNGKPEFYLNAYITPNGGANVTVYTMSENGPDYRRTIRWNYRPEER